MYMNLIPVLLLGLSTLTLSDPIPTFTPTAKQTCPILTKKVITTTTVSVITTLAGPDCPTITSTIITPCPTGVTDPGCFRPACVIVATSTVGCPGVCCPKKKPTTTETYICSTPCVGGCNTFFETETVGCVGTSKTPAPSVRPTSK